MYAAVPGGAHVKAMAVRAATRLAHDVETMTTAVGQITFAIAMERTVDMNKEGKTAKKVEPFMIRHWNKNT